MNKRHRRRASEIANLKTGKPWFTILMIVLGLVVVFFMRSTLSDDTAGLFTELVGDPDLVLPKSVSDQEGALKTDPRADTFRVMTKTQIEPPKTVTVDSGVR